MEFDIVSLNTSYGGMGRSVTHDDFTSKKAKKFFAELLLCYFRYIELMDSPASNLTFNELIKCYSQLKEYDVRCEIIVYAQQPLKDAFGKQIEFLGFDIVHDMAESLLKNSECIDEVARKRLNPYGLCIDLGDVDAIIQSTDSGDVLWNPCWIYRVLV